MSIIRSEDKEEMSELDGSYLHRHNAAELGIEKLRDARRKSSDRGGTESTPLNQPGESEQE